MRMAVIYARVSSEQQREENTIASQTASLIEFAHQHELEVCACPLASNQFAKLGSGLAKAASPYPNEEPSLHCREREVERDDLRVLLQHPWLRASASLKKSPAYR